jgi:hypothetical protein
MQQRHNHIFSLQEAIDLLPTVRELLLQLQAGNDDLDTQSTVLDALLVMSGGGSGLNRDLEEARAYIEETAVRLEATLAQLDGMGVELKGIEQGLVDFPSERDGRIVYLCWRQGEDTISWWHGLDAGFAGRQPL